MEAVAITPIRSVASATWTLVNGGGIVTGFASGTDSTMTTLVPTGAGTVVVQVVAVDNLGASYTAQGTINVAAVLPPVTTSSSGGGGGAFSPIWLALLGLACVALRRRVA